MADILERYRNKFDFNTYVKPYSAKTRNALADAYTQSYFDEEYERIMARAEGNIKAKEPRSLLDRGFDALLTLNYASAGFVDGAIKATRGDEGASPFEAWKGLGRGLLAGNPFGKGYEKGEKTFSDVLETSGWKPDSTAGRLAKGSTGFTLDVLLDPTTYLTAGVSGVVKGTGRVGMKEANKFLTQKATEHGVNKFKNADDLSEQIYESVLARAQQEGATVSQATSRAMQASREVRENFATMTGELTFDQAENIVKRQMSTRGLKKNSAEITKDATRLMEEVNRLRGVRESRDVTFGIGNMPFAPRSWEKYNVTLGKNTGLQKLGDKTLAPAYRKIRAKIYGSKFGQLFTNKHPLFKYAQDEPEKLYDYLKAIEITRGQKAEKLALDKKVRDLAKAMNIEMTPAEQKELLDILQDKSKWKDVTKTIKLAESEEAKAFRAHLDTVNQETKDELKKVLEERDYLENLRDVNSDEIDDIEELLTLSGDQHRERLTQLNARYLQEDSELDKLIGALQKERDELDATDITRFTDEAQHNQLLSMFDEYEGSVKLREEHFTNQGNAKDMPDVDSPKVIRALSEYIFGDSDSIARSIHPDTVKELIDAVRGGADSKALRELIEENPERYKGKATDMYRFIAKQVGYKKWEDDYKKPLDELYKKANNEGLTTADRHELARLEQMNLIRESMKKQLKHLNHDDLMKFIKQVENEQMWKDFEEVNPRLNTHEQAPHNELKREKFNDEDRSNIARKTGEFDDNTSYNTKMTDEMRDDVINDVMARIAMKNGDVKFTDKKSPVFSARYKFAQRVATQMEGVTQSVFGKEYHTLTPKQQDYALKLAFDLVEKNRTPEEAKKIMSASRKKAEEIARQRAKEEKVKAFEKKTQVGDSVIFNLRSGKKEERLNKGEIIGVTEDANGILNYSIKMHDGRIVDNVMAEQFQSVRVGTRNMNGEQLVKSSEIAQEMLSRKEEVAKLLEETKNKRMTNREMFENEYTKLLSDYASRKQKLERDIFHLQRGVDSLNDYLKEGKFDSIDDTIKQIHDADEALWNDDMLETLMRMELGDDAINNAMTTMIPAIELVQNGKVREWAKTIRATFNEVAKKEGIDENFLEAYVPHILTQHGEELLSKHRIVAGADGRPELRPREITEKDASITQDFGYGEIWNPHAETRTIKEITMPDGRKVKNPTIAQINESIAPLLKGKNFFSESIADIYVARMVKHNDLMYDENYMRTMLDTFGDELPDTFIPKKGYKAVMNLGMFRRNATQLASLNVGMHMSDEVGEFVKQLRASDPMMDDDVITQYVEKFIADNFPQERINEIHDEFLNQFYEVKGFSKETLRKTATPMVEVDSEQAKTLSNMYNSTLDAYKQRLDKRMKNAMEYGATPDEVKRIENMQKKLAKTEKLQIKQVNDAIVNKANQARKLQVARDEKRFLQMYDKFTHWVKLMQTTIMPAFHMRNKQSNMYLNWLAVGNDAFNPRFQVPAHIVAHAQGDLDKIAELASKAEKSRFLKGIMKPIVTESGDVYHWNELYELAKAHDVIDEGFFARDIGAGMATKGVMKGVPGKWDITDSENFVGFRKGGEVGNQIENSDRLVHFASLMKQGYAPEDAGRLANQFLFDYSDVTAFEQQVMRRIFPYYTWLRKNGRLQVSQLIDNPAKYRDTAKVMNSVEGGLNEEDKIDQTFVSDFAKDWKQTIFNYTNQDGNTEPILWNPNLPFMDLARLPDPTQPGNSARELFAQVVPQVKLPVELIANKNMYFNSEIRDGKGNGFMQSIDHILRNLAPYTAGVDSVRKDGLDRALHVGNAVTGQKFLSYDYETSKNMKMHDYFNNPEKYAPSALDELGNAVGEQVKRAGGFVAEGLKNGAESALKGLFGAPPTDPRDYDNALRPISVERYNSLSDANKQKYVPPTKDVAMAYNQRAVELEQQAYAESGKVKKFVWALLDKMENAPQSEIGYVTHVADGDTFKVKVGSKEQDVRLLLVDTPESVKPGVDPMPYGKEASQYTKRNLLSKDVRLVFDGTDDYGRRLAYVELDGEDYNKELIEEGLGKTRYLFDGDEERMRQYYQVQQQAMREGRNIWSIPNYAYPEMDSGYNGAITRQLAQQRK